MKMSYLVLEAIKAHETFSVSLLVKYWYVSATVGTTRDIPNV